MKTEIEIDMYADISAEGITRALYLGEACEPNFEGLETWEEIVERNIGYHTIPDNTISPMELIELDKTVAGLEYALALFRTKMGDLTVTVTT